MHVFDPGAVAGETRGGIDTVDYVDGLPGLVLHPRPTVMPLGAPLLVSGWAVDPESAGPALAVCVLLDRSRPLYARIGIARGEIAREHSTDEFVGFQLALATGDLAAGAHEMHTYALGSDGFWYVFGSATFRLYRHPFPSGITLSRALLMSMPRPIDIAAGKEIAKGAAVRANRWLLFQGWAFDSALQRGPATIAAFDEDGRTWSGPSDIARPDVAATLQSSENKLGFEITIPTAVFERGTHSLKFVGFDEDGHRYANSTASIIDVIATQPPFPLTARCMSMSQPFTAHLRAVEPLDDDDEGVDDAPNLQATLPVREPLTIPKNATIHVEGLALDEGGRPADDVFLELNVHGIHVPPRRLAADYVLRSPAAGIASDSSVENSSFRCSFSLSKMKLSDCDLALVVVQPGRRSYSRVPLATLRLTS